MRNPPLQPLGKPRLLDKLRAALPALLAHEPDRLLDAVV